MGSICYCGSFGSHSRPRTCVVPEGTQPIHSRIGGEQIMSHPCAYTREDELSEPVRGLFSGQEYFVKHEVPFGLKRIDLVFRKRDCSDLVAVELKLRDWK